MMVKINRIEIIEYLQRLLKGESEHCPLEFLKQLMGNMEDESGNILDEQT